MFKRSATSRKLAILWALYFVQGLPFGFQATALPVYLREAGVSLAGIGLVTALALPWALKLFWAPLVDRYGSGALGRRRSWILPLQVCLAVCCAAGALVPPEEGLTVLLLLVLMMNFFAATMDVAVDGLAVDLLESGELGKGNIAQVVGYKIGMLTGGGILVWASAYIGWRGLFISMAGSVVLTIVVTATYRENHRSAAGDSLAAMAHPSLREILSILRQAVMRPSTGWVLLFVATYKLGENMADTMFKPFLVDAGYGPAQIGLWVGTWGMLFSIAGSFSGGYLASRIRLLDALAITACLRALPVAGEWWLAYVGATESRVLVVTCAEHFFGGALTTALFAFMMSRVDKRIGATHYTLLASVEVWGKLPSAWASGVITQATSYQWIFALATVLSLLFLLLLIPLYRHRRPRTA